MMGMLEYMEPLVLIPHRGESENYPENTLLALEKALDGGARILECDIHLSQDGHIVVIHDPTLDRTTDRSGTVADMDWEKISRASAGYPSRFGDRYVACRVPRLKEVLDLVRNRARLLIEIKPEAVGFTKPSRLIVALMDLLAKEEMLDQVVLLSFHHEALRQCRDLSPNVKLAALFHRWSRKNPVTIANSIGADFMIFNKKLLTWWYLARMRHRRQAIGAYTVNTVKEVQSLYRKGVRALATDRFTQLRRELCAVGWESRIDVTGDYYLKGSSA